MRSNCGQAGDYLFIFKLFISLVVKLKNVYNMIMKNYSFKTRLLNINLILQKANIKEGYTVADLGCGKFGHFSFLAAKRVGSHGKVYAVDIMKANLEMIKKEAKASNLENIKTIWSDLEILKATKIDSNSVDLIFLINVLHESKQPLKIIAEALRMMKTSAKLIIVDWEKIAAPLGPKKELRVDKNFLKAGAQKLGLYLEEELEAGQYHFGLIFTKP
ncbi:MAG: methyltransferase domain-containing protein [bacterium]